MGVTPRIQLLLPFVRAGGALQVRAVFAMMLVTRGPSLVDKLCLMLENATWANKIFGTARTWMIKDAGASSTYAHDGQGPSLQRCDMLIYVMSCCIMLAPPPRGLITPLSLT